MKTKTILAVVMMLFVCATAQAQSSYRAKAEAAVENLLKVGDKVENLNIKDLSGNTVPLKYFGNKNVLIFYVDPDAYLNGNNTADFAKEIEENGRAAGPAIEGLGVMNFIDTGLPKNMLRKICAKRTEKNGATILDDDAGEMKRAWRLGNCNGKFLLILVDKAGIVRYIRREPMDEIGKADFYNMIEKYRY